MERKLSRSLVIVATLAVYACLTQVAAARGGGHGGGGHHGGGHHGGHNHHAYHPSHHHASHHHSSHHHDGHHDHHHDGHHDHHHYAHHHHGWHHGGWGPGFWGGAAVGYGLGYGYGNWGGYGYGGDGDTYVDNSTNVTPVSDQSDAGNIDDAGDDSADDQGDDQSTAGNAAGDQGFPTDDWPELGVVTYAGQYGGSQGQVIMRVVPGSAAEKAGLVPGDVILTFNGKPVPSADDLDSAMDSAGGKFEVNVWDARTGRKSTISGTLDPNAEPPATETASAPVQQ